MMRTIEATVDECGQIHLEENVVLHGPVRALVTILDDDFTGTAKLNESAILAEASLAAGWSGKSADEAWNHLANLPDLDKVRQ